MQIVINFVDQTIDSDKYSSDDPMTKELREDYDTNTYELIEVMKDGTNIIHIYPYQNILRITTILKKKEVL